MYPTLSRGEIASLLTRQYWNPALSSASLLTDRQTGRFLAGSAAPTGSARLNRQVAQTDSGALSLQCAKAFIVPTPSSPDAVAHHSRNKTLVMWAMQISSYEQPIQTTTVAPGPSSIRLLQQCSCHGSYTPFGCPLRQFLDGFYNARKRTVLLFIETMLWICIPWFAEFHLGMSEMSVMMSQARPLSRGTPNNKQWNTCFNMISN